MAKRIEAGVDGVVIAHGTDTMAYTSAALSFALQNLPVPVIVVGAQRSSDRPSSDAATNLIGAVKAAGEAPFAEVGLAMHEAVSDIAIVVHRGTKVRKCHTSRRDTFKSINGFPIARVKDQQVTMLADKLPETRPEAEAGFEAELLRESRPRQVLPGLDPAVIDWYVSKGFKGILLEGSGLGHVSKFCFDAIKNATAKGVVVALASQCIWGRVNMNVYDTGRDLLALRRRTHRRHVPRNRARQTHVGSGANRRPEGSQEAVQNQHRRRIFAAHASARRNLGGRRVRWLLTTRKSG